MELEPYAGALAAPEREAARVTRELRRLEALVGRRRFRTWVRRGLRGGLGAGVTLIALIKLKVAASLSIKLGLAALVGFGLVFPPLFVALLAVAGLVVALVTCEGDCDCPGDCGEREKRRSRLDPPRRTTRHKGTGCTGCSRPEPVRSSSPRRRPDTSRPRRQPRSPPIRSPRSTSPCPHPEAEGSGRV